MANETEKLSAAQRSKIRRLSAPKELSPDEEGGELNIVPFLDIIMNVLMFVLATVSVTFTATVDTEPPRAGGGGGARKNETPSLNLTVLVVREGFSLKARGGNVAAGCNDAGPGIAVPKKGEDYDFAALTACARKLKGLSPDFQDEQSVTISASPDIPYRFLIGAIDAVRRDPDMECNADEKGSEWTGSGCLFPKVQFTVIR